MKYHLEYEIFPLRGIFHADSDNFHEILNILVNKASETKLTRWRLVERLPGMEKVLAVQDPEARHDP